MATAMDGTADQVEGLLADGADPDDGDSQGRFALACAAFAGNEAAAATLIRAGADVDRSSDEGGLPVEAAVIGGNVLVEDSGEPVAGVAPPDDPARLTIISLLDRAGADLAPAVTHAARLGNLASLETLLNLDAPAAGEGNKQSPMLAAASNGACDADADCPVIDALLDAGASPDDGGTMPHFELLLYLRLVASSNDSESSLTTDLEIELPNEGTMTPTAGAALNSEQGALKRLLDAGADPNALTFETIPTLWLAVLARNEPGVEALLDAGAEPTPDGVPEWAQPIDLATATEQEAVVQALTG